MTILRILETPTLLLDHQKLFKNISDIADFAKEQGVCVESGCTWDGKVKGTLTG
jgi:D-serine deaminase-like pyridoxal phosphate-dependent protein